MKWGAKYSAKYVNILESMLARHLHMDYELICITDAPEGIQCRTVPLWEDNSEGCFRRLEMFKPEMREVLGDRFVSIDLDCVIVDDVTPLFSRTEDFIIQENPFNADMYGGALFMMNAGARAEVAEVPRMRHGPWSGTDQAVIRATLGPDQAKWTEDDGVYQKLKIKGRLPENARIVFYAGPRDPSTDKADWAREHWR